MLRSLPRICPVLCVGLLVGVTPSDAATIRVPSDYTTIQASIDAGAFSLDYDGETLSLPAASYAGRAPDFGAFETGK